MREFLAVFVGGLLGTALRLGLDVALPHAEAGFPVSTLTVNLVGAFALGLLVARVWPTAAPWLRAGLGTGVLGSFTTFSAVAVSTVRLAGSGAGATLVLYLVLTVVGGLGAALIGILLGRRAGTRGRADRSSGAPAQSSGTGRGGDAE